MPQPQNAAAPRRHAEATVRVVRSEREPWDEAAEATLAEVRITETFAGDLEGESTVRALEISGAPTHLVSVQRFRGRLHGRRGAFVLEGRETIEAGRVRATWTVTPGSGTDELQGLRGEGGFEGEFGKGSHATLDYWFA
ncbi:MAG: DUF3224 domain-containing protein [Caulobacterales bacterium]|nr:DUF3224 domain-containing protein [Caulobacterales bacterium]